MKFITAVIAATILSTAGVARAEPVVNASVDCTTFHVEVVGNDTATVIIAVGGNPPYGLDGTVTDIHIPAWDQQHGFVASVDVGPTRYFEQRVACNEPAPPPSPQQQALATVDPQPIVPLAPEGTTWSGLELAPPW